MTEGVAERHRDLNRITETQTELQRDRQKYSQTDRITEDTEEDNIEIEREEQCEGKKRASPEFFCQFETNCKKKNCSKFHIFWSKDNYPRDIWLTNRIMKLLGLVLTCVMAL